MPRGRYRPGVRLGTRSMGTAWWMILLGMPAGPAAIPSPGSAHARVQCSEFRWKKSWKEDSSRSIRESDGRRLVQWEMTASRRDAMSCPERHVLPARQNYPLSRQHFGAQQDAGCREQRPPRGILRPCRGHGPMGSGSGPAASGARRRGSLLIARSAGPHSAPGPYGFGNEPRASRWRVLSPSSTRSWIARSRSDASFASENIRIARAWNWAKLIAIGFHP